MVTEKKETELGVQLSTIALNQLAGVHHGLHPQRKIKEMEFNKYANAYGVNTMLIVATVKSWDESCYAQLILLWQVYCVS